MMQLTACKNALASGGSRPVGIGDQATRIISLGGRHHPRRPLSRETDVLTSSTVPKRQNVAIETELAFPVPLVMIPSLPVLFPAIGGQVIGIWTVGTEVVTAWHRTYSPGGCCRT